MKFNAIKLNFSMTEMVEQKLNFVLKKEEEIELWRCIYSTLALFAEMAVGVYGCLDRTLISCWCPRQCVGNQSEHCFGGEWGMRRTVLDLSGNVEHNYI